MLWLLDCIWSRYERLSVLNTMCRNLLFHIFGVLWTITVLLITFCQEGPQMLHEKFGANCSNHLGGVRKSIFFHLTRFCEGKVTAKFSSIQRARKYNVSQCATYYVGVMGQKCFCVDNSTTCIFGVWVTGASLYHPYQFNFHNSYGVGTVPNIKSKLQAATKGPSQSTHIGACCHHGVQHRCI